MGGEYVVGKPIPSGDVISWRNINVIKKQFL